MGKGFVFARPSVLQGSIPHLRMRCSDVYLSQIEGRSVFATLRDRFAIPAGTHDNSIQVG
jgi:hypothetical protein